jgi:hypothetical protein
VSEQQGPRRPDQTLDMSGEEPTLPMQGNRPAGNRPNSNQPPGRPGGDRPPTGGQRPHNYSPGKAAVGRAGSGSEPTLTFEEDSTAFGGPGIATRTSLKQPSVPSRQRIRMLRRGGRWSAIGAAVLVGCWGLFALSSLSGDLAPATLALLVILAVGVFLFALSRMVGLVVLERSMGRVRRSAWASHAVAGLFWIASGVTYLTRIGWIVDAFNWIRGVR